MHDGKQCTDMYMLTSPWRVGEMHTVAYTAVRNFHDKVKGNKQNSKVENEPREQESSIECRRARVQNSVCKEQCGEKSMITTALLTSPT